MDGKVFSEWSVLAKAVILESAWFTADMLPRTKTIITPVFNPAR